jgi:serine protease Do
MHNFDFKKFFLGVFIGVLILAAAVGGVIAEKKYNFKALGNFFPGAAGQAAGTANQKVVSEESVVIDVAKNVSPSVVTVEIQTAPRRVLQFSPFGGFTQGITGGQPQNIGSGFIVGSDGLIVTNKHVVSDTTATYKVVTKDKKEYVVAQISRDPNNDIAVLKIDASGLIPVTLGDSGNLQVGQMVVAIGTALGQFPDTVTTGVISGLGRGITAGDTFQGYVEQLDDVIQTDASINPGNSGGPLVNSGGQVIGINVAIAQGANNIGFAIPVNVVKDALNQFKTNGKFPAKAYLGVEYQMIDLSTAVMNNVPQGALVASVVSGSPADRAGVQEGDIITKINGNAITDGNGGLSKVISGLKVGDKVELEVYRNGSTLKLSATLSESGQ